MSKKGIERKKRIAKIVLIYFMIGFVYGMVCETCLAKKYGHPPLTAFLDPYAYLRSVVNSPFWPLYVYWSIYHGKNPFGCHAREKVQGL